MKHPLVTCNACHGSGKVTLDGPLLSTYAFFSSAATKLTAPKIAESISTPGHRISISAVINRLESLRGFGLLMRERPNGRTWTYRRPKAGEIEEDENGCPIGVERGPIEMRAQENGAGLSNAAKSEPMRALAGATFKPKRGQKKV